MSDDDIEEDYMSKEWILRRWNRFSDPAYKRIMASKMKAEARAEEE